MIQSVLILGSGGREHALVMELLRDLPPHKILVAPGNAGTGIDATNVDLDASDFNNVLNFCQDNKISILIPGQEVFIVSGIKDFFLKNHAKTLVIAPQTAAAMLEGSKTFAKQFMEKNKIPTARYLESNIHNLEESFKFLEKLSPPYVLKADGLAAGKGVLILNDLEEAKVSLENMLKGQFGKASERVVIEEYLDGIEMSFFILCNGENYVCLPSAKDYKRALKGDKGLNTGGMGCISPVPFVDNDLNSKIIEKIVEPTLKGLAQENLKYEGFIFFGLMIVNNNPFVIEYNVRLGDPETEVILPRLKTSLLQLIERLFLKKEQVVAQFTDQNAACVFLIAEGYPEKYKKGNEIVISENSEVQIIHAGTLQVEEKIITNGGRVIAIRALDQNLDNCLSKIYKNLSCVNYEGKTYRDDIGYEFRNGTQ